MLGPSLVNTLKKLKKLIPENKDTSFSKKGYQQGSICGM